MLKTLDPKLLYTVLSFAVARIALALGVELDPTLETAIAGIIAAAVGYRVPNDGSVLRTPQETGNAEPPVTA